MRGSTVNPDAARRLGLVIGVPLVAAMAILLVAATTGASGPLPPAGLPDCTLAEKPAPRAGYHQWAETLLDTGHTLPHHYVPPDLERRNIGGRLVTLREFVFQPLEDMLIAAARDGMTVRVNSGYRSYAQQRALVDDHGIEADMVARPGHSEHQLGTAVDLSGGAAWLAENGWRYGFVLSYPAQRSPTWTCYRQEPWHFRYFGAERAARIVGSGLSPREWLWQALGEGRRVPVPTYHLPRGTELRAERERLLMPGLGDAGDRQFGTGRG